MESGRTRSMADRFLLQQQDDAATAAAGAGAGDRPSKPAWLIELENAKETEYGVFENEPEVFAQKCSQTNICMYAVSYTHLTLPTTPYV